MSDLTPRTALVLRVRIAHFVLVVMLAAGSLAHAGGALMSLPPHGLVSLGLAALALVVALRMETVVGTVSLTGDWGILLICLAVMPQVAPLVGLCSIVVAGMSHRQRLVIASADVVTIQAGALAIAMLGTPTSLGDVPAVAAAAFAAMVAGNLACYLPIAWFNGLDVWRYATSGFQTELAMLPLAIPLIALMVLVEPATRPWIWLLALGPMLVIHVLQRQYAASVIARDDIASKAQLLARTNLQFAAAMVRALDHRDAYTAGHSAAVAVYTRDIAREMGMDDELVRQAHLAGLLHDIGKIGVPGRVLNKTAPLDDEEYEVMKSHAAMGAEILGEVDLYGDIAHLVRFHHERIDGRGYPDQLEGEMIPAISRIISVADTYSAMTTDRPYRDGMPTQRAMSILAECRGTQLDSEFTDAFLRILAAADASYQRGTQVDFELEVAKHQAVSQVEAEVIRMQAPVCTPAALDIEREAA